MRVQIKLIILLIAFLVLILTIGASIYGPGFGHIGDFVLFLMSIVSVFVIVGILFVKDPEDDDV